MNVIEPLSHLPDVFALMLHCLWLSQIMPSIEMPTLWTLLATAMDTPDVGGEDFSTEGTDCED